MNRTLLGLVALLFWTSSVFAQSDGVREVSANERGLITLNTKLRFTTMVILPDGEEIVDVICGDKDWWIISATHDIAHIKPAKEGATTNLNLVTTSGKVYSFILIEGKAVFKPDLKVYVVEDTMMGGLKTGRPKYATAAQVEALEGELQRANAAIEAALKSGEKAVEEVRASLPGMMKFPYQPVPYEQPFLVRSIYHDGTFTYIKTDARERPALYEIVDGQPAMVNFQMPQPDTYVVPKVLESAYFVLGKKRLAVRRLVGN